MSENYNWQKDLTTKLVVLYQECANLYDPNDPTYDDEEIRAATLDEIVTELKQFDPSLTLDIVWSKIQSFHNEMALIKADKAAGKTIDTHNSDNSWLINKLRFLEKYTMDNELAPIIAEHGGVGNNVNHLDDVYQTVSREMLTSVEFCDMDAEQTTAGFAATPVQVAKKRKFKDTPRPSTSRAQPLHEYAPPTQSVDSSTYQQTTPDVDDNEVWVRFVLTELKRFKNEDNREDTKWKMLNVLKENLMKDRAESRYSPKPTTSTSSSVKRRVDKYDHDYY